jgi:hypothetical protein
MGRDRLIHPSTHPPIHPSTPLFIPHPSSFLLSPSLYKTSIGHCCGNALLCVFN